MNNKHANNIKKWWLITIISTVFFAALDLLYDLPPSSSISEWLQSDVFFSFRFPRVVGAILGGICLAWSGLMMQTLFRNPLAGPFLIGITPGASFGIAIITFLGGTFQFSLGFGSAFSPTLPAAALIGALGVMGLQWQLHKKWSDLNTLLLGGLILGYFFGAAIDILQRWGEANQLKFYTMWGQGSFDRLDTSQLTPLAIMAIIGGIILYTRRYSFNNYLLGDIHVESAGSNLKNLRKELMVGSAIMAAITTAYCGPISFVGIIAPHLSKMLTKTEAHEKNIALTALIGAALTIAADFIAHYAIPNFGLPLNAVLSIIGAPFVFLILLTPTSQRG